jgi:hypothetical protein
MVWLFMCLTCHCFCPFPSIALQYRVTECLFNFTSLEGLNQIKGLRVNVAAVETNIVSTFIAKVLKCASHSSSLQLGLETSFLLLLPFVLLSIFS